MSRMSVGVLLFCIDTPEVKYSRIANRCISQIQKHLKLPITVCTDHNTCNNWQGELPDCSFVHIDVSGGNFKEGRQWYNLDRCCAYDYSPYETTIVLDVDYFCFTDNLLQLIDTNLDVAVYAKAHDVTHRMDLEHAEHSMIPMVWATVLVFKKTQRAKELFELVKYVKENYNYFCYLYKINFSNFRNDYAFAIALHMQNGHFLYDVIPGSIPTLPADAVVTEFLDNGVEAYYHDTFVSLHDSDIHVLNKSVEELC